MIIDQLRGLPSRPGVYLFRDSEGGILYIGKAKSLRSRVKSYFRGSGQSLKTQEMIRQIVEVDTIVVGSETESLILEANLIKEHKPRFNIQLRDDKRYPYIKVTIQEAFPRVFVTRRLEDDGSQYFGPYTSVGLMRDALEVVKRLYTVRSCRYDLPKESPERPCLDYHIGRCLAPCVGYQDQNSYGIMINEILKVLGGETEYVRDRVQKQMSDASRGLEFERAAHLRDIITALDGMAHQQLVEDLRGNDYDLIGIARDGDIGVGVVMKIRRGVLLGRDTIRFSEISECNDGSLLDMLTSRYYLGGSKQPHSDFPKEILVPVDFENKDILKEVLFYKNGYKVDIRIPKRGIKRRLCELATDNARHALEDRLTTTRQFHDRADEVLYDLSDKLQLKVVPRFIACFDVSHIQGSETVGSAVVFENAEPKKSEYRRMRIRGDWGNDDYRSMAEVVSRYFSYRLENELPLPDLVLIDGGKGQLRSAHDSLNELGVTDMPMISLAKRKELVFRLGTREPLRFKRRDNALHVLQRIRDEAHRFAVTYNRKLRRNRTVSSDLSEIPGIGPEKQKLLLLHFGSVRAIKSANVEEIAKISGLGLVLADRIITYLG